MTEKTDTELEMLKRIVALLLSLAGLCRLAAHAPQPVRVFVLWLMRRAETIARNMVAGPVDDDGYWPAAVRVGNEPEDALRLAASLRELARSVRKMAAEYRHFIRQCEREEAGELDGEQRPAVIKPHRTGAIRELLSQLTLAPCPDTS